MNNISQVQHNFYNTSILIGKSKFPSIELCIYKNSDSKSTWTDYTGMNLLQNGKYVTKSHTSYLKNFIDLYVSPRTTKETFNTHETIKNNNIEIN